MRRSGGESEQGSLAQSGLDDAVDDETHELGRTHGALMISGDLDVFAGRQSCGELLEAPDHRVRASGDKQCPTLGRVDSGVERIFPERFGESEHRRAIETRGADELSSHPRQPTARHTTREHLLDIVDIECLKRFGGRKAAENGESCATCPCQRPAKAGAERISDQLACAVPVHNLGKFRYQIGDAEGSPWRSAAPSVTRQIYHDAADSAETELGGESGFFEVGSAARPKSMQQEHRAFAVRHRVGHKTAVSWLNRGSIFIFHECRVSGTSELEAWLAGMEGSEVTADPTRILDIATGYMASKQLFGAARIGLFAAIAEGHDTVATAAAVTGHPERTVRILLDGAAASGLLKRRDGVYALEEDAATYLTGGEHDLGAFLDFLEVGSFRAFDDHWSHTVDADEGGTVDWNDKEFLSIFMAGVTEYNDLHAYWFGERFPTAGHTSVLDFGGFTAGWSIEAMKRNPELKVTFAYPSSESLKPAVEAAGFAERVKYQDLPTETGVPGGAHDLVLAIHVIHRYTADQNRAIFANLRASAITGAELGVFDFFLDSSDAQRSLDARHAAEYFNFDGTVVWPESTVVEWLEASDWRFSHYVEVPGSPRLLVATAV